jgi:L-seryl-tRNA(Ser) seleniumtransferase
MRADKMTLAALEATLALYQDSTAARARVPVLRMLTLSPATLAERAGRLQSLLASLPWPAAAPVCQAEQSTPGGGSFPGATLATTVVVLDPGPLTAEGLARSLRGATIPVVGRVHADRVLLDPRTCRDEDLEVIAGACREVLTAAAS